jgi:peroxiredoxin
MKIFTIAPEFELPDFDGNPVKLSDFQGSKNLVLVFLRGFM